MKKHLQNQSGFNSGQKSIELKAKSAVEELKTVKKQNRANRKEIKSLNRQLAALKIKLQSKQKHDEGKKKIFNKLNQEIKFISDNIEKDKEKCRNGVESDVMNQELLEVQKKINQLKNSIENIKISRGHARRSSSTQNLLRSFQKAAEDLENKLPKKNFDLEMVNRDTMLDRDNKRMTKSQFVSPGRVKEKDADEKELESPRWGDLKQLKKNTNNSQETLKKLETNYFSVPQNKNTVVNSRNVASNEKPKNIVPTLNLQDIFVHQSPKQDNLVPENTSQRETPRLGYVNSSDNTENKEDAQREKKSKVETPENEQVVTMRQLSLQGESELSNTKDSNLTEKVVPHGNKSFQLQKRGQLSGQKNEQSYLMVKKSNPLRTSYQRSDLLSTPKNTKKFPKKPVNEQDSEVMSSHRQRRRNRSNSLDLDSRGREHSHLVNHLNSHGPLNKRPKVGNKHKHKYESDEKYLEVSDNNPNVERIDLRSRSNSPRQKVCRLKENVKNFEQKYGYKPSDSDYEYEFGNKYSQDSIISHTSMEELVKNNNKSFLGKSQQKGKNQRGNRDGNVSGAPDHMKQKSKEYPGSLKKKDSTFIQKDYHTERAPYREDHSFINASLVAANNDTNSFIDINSTVGDNESRFSEALLKSSNTFLNESMVSMASRNIQKLRVSNYFWNPRYMRTGVSSFPYNFVEEDMQDY